MQGRSRRPIQGHAGRSSRLLHCRRRAEGRHDRPLQLSGASAGCVVVAGKGGPLLRRRGRGLGPAGLRRLSRSLRGLRRATARRGDPDLSLLAELPGAHRDLRSGRPADRHAARPGRAGLVALEDGIRPGRGDPALRLVHPRGAPEAVRRRALGLRPRDLLCGARVLRRADGPRAPPLSPRAAAGRPRRGPAGRSRRDARGGTDVPRSGARPRAGPPWRRTSAARWTMGRT